LLEFTSVYFGIESFQRVTSDSNKKIRARLRLWANGVFDPFSTGVRVGDGFDPTIGKRTASFWLWQEIVDSGSQAAGHERALVAPSVSRPAGSCH
jgi:hypothetical protein